jgi:DNA-binding transcriptional regulator YiaG
MGASIKRVRKHRTDRRALGNEIKKLRLAAKIGSQAKFAAMLDVSQSAVAQWETGVNEPSSENLRAIADVCRADIGELMRIVR